MGILNKHAPVFNIIKRILDICILLIITWLFGKKYGDSDLIRVLATYGGLLLFVIFSLLNIYKSWRNVSIGSQIRSLFLAWFSVLIVFNATILLLSSKEQLAVLWPFALFRLPEFLLWSLLVFLGLVVCRVVVKFFLIYFRRKGFNQRHAVIVGTGETGRKLARYLDENRWMGIQLRGFFDDRYAEGDAVTNSPTVLGSVLGSAEECAGFALANSIDMVFIALPMQAEKKINKLIWDLGTKGVSVVMVPDLFTLGIQKARPHLMGELPLLDFNLFPGWKRSFDIIFSFIIIVLSLPVWLTIILFIKMENGGPVFYKHPRVTEGGKSFNCLKFRTMYPNADKRLRELLDQDPALQEEWEHTYKLKNDPRVTKAGRFLRKTSLDELPQFLNIIVGDMSVVGARPVVPEELEKYYKKTALTYCAMKPGITGIWQVGKRNDTVNYDERVELDRWYVLNCSLWLDIRVIIKTIWRIIRPKGAY